MFQSHHVMGACGLLLISIVALILMLSSQAGKSGIIVNWLAVSIISVLSTILSATLFYFAFKSATNNSNSTPPNETYL